MFGPGTHRYTGPRVGTCGSVGGWVGLGTQILPPPPGGYCLPGWAQPECLPAHRGAPPPPPVGKRKPGAGAGAYILPLHPSFPLGASSHSVVRGGVGIAGRSLPYQSHWHSALPPFLRALLPFDVAIPGRASCEKGSFHRSCRASDAVGRTSLSLSMSSAQPRHVCHLLRPVPPPQGVGLRLRRAAFSQTRREGPRRNPGKRASPQTCTPD